MEFVTAPLTFENHFSAAPVLMNGRMKMIVVFFLFGWIFGCVIAELTDKRKAIMEWLKQ